MTAVATMMFLGLVYIAGQGAQNAEIVSPVAPTATPVVKADLLSASERADWMEGCDPDGKQTAYCTCALDWLLNVYGRDGVIRLANQYAETEQAPQEILGAITACFELYK